MQVEIIFCPSCQQKLRIPSDWLGQPVQCPICRTTFVGPPPPDSDGEVATSVAVSRANHADSNRSPDWVGPAMLGAGLLMIAAALVGLFASAVKIALGTSPRLMRAMMRQNPLGEMAQQIDPNQLKIAGIVFSLISLAALLGGIAMLRRRPYFLAFIGSLAALINVGDCCTILTAPPIGLGCLILLLLPQVRTTFSN